MSISNLVARFFCEIEKTWNAVPDYVKVFLFSTSSSIAGLYFTNVLTWESVLAILLVNLGLYSIPRGAEVVNKKLSED